MAVSERKKEGIVSSSSSVATFLTEAWPQRVPVCAASDSKKAAPAHSHESSPVARRTFGVAARREREEGTAEEPRS